MHSVVHADATKGDLSLPLSLGIGLYGIVLVSSDTYELRHVIRQHLVEDMHVELTASGNLDLCFRVGVRL